MIYQGTCVCGILITEIVPVEDGAEEESPANYYVMCESCEELVQVWQVIHFAEAVDA